MRKHLPEEIGVKAAGGIQTVDQVLEVYEAGCRPHRHHCHGRDSGRMEGPTGTPATSYQRRQR